MKRKIIVEKEVIHLLPIRKERGCTVFEDNLGRFHLKNSKGHYVGVQGKDKWGNEIFIRAFDMICHKFKHRDGEWYLKIRVNGEGYDRKFNLRMESFVT